MKIRNWVVMAEFPGGILEGPSRDIMTKHFTGKSAQSMRERFETIWARDEDDLWAVKYVFGTPTFVVEQI